MVGFALLTALMLNGKIRTRGFISSVFFFSVLLSPVVVALIWKWILQHEGLANAVLEGMGFYTLILLVGLQAIPRDVYEAASMDAVNPRC